MDSLIDVFYAGKEKLGHLSHPELEAKALFLRAAGISESEFFTHPDEVLPKKIKKRFHLLIERRRKGEPLSYLTGKKEFWSLAFHVSPGVFIPRPETELMIEKALSLVSDKECNVIDIGTGSGNIAVVMALERPHVRVTATDISKRALKTAKMNADLHGIRNVTFLQGHLLEPLDKLGLQKECDIIVSNPPYIPSGEWKSLSPEIRNNEPKKALVSGKTGLEVIRGLVEVSPYFLKPGGFLVLEIGFGQSQHAITLFKQDWSEVECYDDLNGIPRVVVARYE